MMRYNAENGKIFISSYEFVSIARRGISPFIPYDDEEPVLREATHRFLSKALGKHSPEKLIYSFENGEFEFEIISYAEKIDSGEIWLAREISGNPARPKKEEKAQIRGEGYVAALTYLKANGAERVVLNLVYVNSETGEYTSVKETVTRTAAERFFKNCLTAVSIYAKPEIDRVTVRIPSMKTLKFPYKSIRQGQREFLQKTYKSIARGGTLFATAPTGTGKTVSVLYPAIRAMGDARCDKTFYLTPKETTANAAIDCLKIMAKSGAVIRAVKLTSKEKNCKSGLLCREDRANCKNAQHNNLADATLALYNKNLTVAVSEDIAEIAENFCVCPYELSLTYAEICDVIICDFNYLFDPSVYIRRFFTQGGNFTFLVDEAHNLPDRAREMYSDEISSSFLLSLAESELLGAFSNTKNQSELASARFFEVMFPYVKEEIITAENGTRSGASHTKDIPFELYDIFDGLIKTAEEEILLNYSAKDEEQKLRLKLLQEYCYKIKKFRSVMQRFDSSYEAFIFYSDGDIRVKLFCIDPGKEISERISLGKSAVFFSATLAPLYYYKSVLGGDGASDMLEIDSPFDSSQLSVTIMDKISTRFSERKDTLSAVCRVIAATVSAKRGNYIIFSPSFAYSDALAEAFRTKYPNLNIISQKRNMNAKEKESFLAEFTKENNSYLIGFCVMGGIYAEGIDLAGESLIGAVVVGIGMPMLSYEREAICAYYDDKYEEGKQFSYIYPGMNRVLQAAGRVIRREDDKGVIVLIDDRFDDPIYKKIIPTLWSGMKFFGDPKQLRASLDDFWREERK